jgi:hypothetical protein
MSGSPPSVACLTQPGTGSHRLCESARSQQQDAQTNLPETGGRLAPRLVRQYAGRRHSSPQCERRGAHCRGRATPGLRRRGGRPPVGRGGAGRSRRDARRRRLRRGRRLGRGRGLRHGPVPARRSALTRAGSAGPLGVRSSALALLGLVHARLAGRLAAQQPPPLRPQKTARCLHAGRQRYMRGGLPRGAATQPQCLQSGRSACKHSVLKTFMSRCRIASAHDAPGHTGGHHGCTSSTSQSSRPLAPCLPADRRAAPALAPTPALTRSAASCSAAAPAPAHPLLSATARSAAP